MKYTITIVLFLICFQTAGQDTVTKKHSVFLELAGSGGIGSFNYERIFSAKKQWQFSWQAGITGFPIDKNAGFVFVFPVSINTMIAFGNHHIEAGFGQGISITTRGSFFALTTPKVGYRYDPEGSPLYFRLMYTPLISYILDDQYQHWGGISIGYQIPSKP